MTATADWPGELVAGLNGSPVPRSGVEKPFTNVVL